MRLPTVFHQPLMSVALVLMHRSDIEVRRHQTCDFRERARYVPAELGGEIRNVSRNRARTQVRLQARKLHVYGSSSFGAFWESKGANQRI